MRKRIRVRTRQRKNETNTEYRIRIQETFERRLRKLRNRTPVNTGLDMIKEQMPDEIDEDDLE